MGLSFYMKDVPSDKGKCLRRAKRALKAMLLGKTDGLILCTEKTPEGEVPLIVTTGAHLTNIMTFAFLIREWSLLWGVKAEDTLPLLGRLLDAETQAEAEKLLETFSIEKLPGSQNRANPRNFQGVGSGAC